MSQAGILLMVLGGLFIILPGIYFYQYIQNSIATSTATAAGTTNPAATLALINELQNSPVMVTLAFFGLGFIMVGGVFVVGANIAGHLETTNSLIENRPITAPQALAAQPAPVFQNMKACTKCGSFISANNAFCPNCGSPQLKVQTMIPATA